MSKRLDENLGYVGPDNLIADMYPPTDPFTVKIRKEATEAATYKRGTVLALSAGTAGDGKFVILGTTAADSDQRDIDGQLRARGGRRSRHRRRHRGDRVPYRAL